MSAPIRVCSSEEVLANYHRSNSLKEEAEREIVNRNSSFSLNDWRNAFIEKENEIKLVAEIGQALLETTKRDEISIQRLSKELEEREFEVEHWKQLAKDLKDEKTKLDRQLRNAEELNGNVMKELEEGQHQQKLKLAEHKVNTYLMEQNKELLDDLEGYKLELHKKSQNEEALKGRITKLEKQLNSLEESTKRMKDSKRKDDSDSSSSYRLQILAMSENLHEAQKTIAELEEKLHTNSRELEDVEMSKEILSREIECLLKSNDDLLQKLSAKSNQIIELHSKLEDFQYQSTLSSSADLNKGSIFSELEDQINKDKERASQKLLRAESLRSIKNSTSPNRPTSPDPKQAKKDMQSGIYGSPATEEYFYLTCSAIKVNMAFKQKSEDVFMVRDDELFSLASSQKIPFHEWHEWLEKQFESRTAKQPEVQVRPRSASSFSMPFRRNSQSSASKK
eukprot:TRINITY_DN717_c0_g1_i1.p1 TRINITY_DN717_c0_g1~~TRINITY_DN717_c0_g1_i1.p1  ORF type:complete len:451 (-),score=192.44 TRINITY_DN717_c0_g1_i1:813-2165(-)